MIYRIYQIEQVETLNTPTADAHFGMCEKHHILKELNIFPMRAEHPSMQSALEEIDSFRQDLHGKNLTVIPVISL